MCKNEREGVKNQQTKEIKIVKKQTWSRSVNALGKPRVCPPGEGDAAADLDVRSARLLEALLQSPFPRWETVPEHARPNSNLCEADSFPCQCSELAKFTSPQYPTHPFPTLPSCPETCLEAPRWRWVSLTSATVINLLIRYPLQASPQ